VTIEDRSCGPNPYLFFSLFSIRKKWLEKNQYCSYEMNPFSEENLPREITRYIVSQMSIKNGFSRMDYLNTLLTCSIFSKLLSKGDKKKVRKGFRIFIERQDGKYGLFFRVNKYWAFENGKKDGPREISTTKPQGFRTIGKYVNGKKFGKWYSTSEVSGDFFFREYSYVDGKQVSYTRFDKN
jgi:hypothetical protein